MRPAGRSRLAMLLICAALLPRGGEVLAQKGKEAAKELSGDAHYKKWLNEDVVYIITEEERAVFEKLQTPEERERFVEQFWTRRDPTPGTPENEFREEHYRRIHYANEQFYSGKAGWQTDRGRIYIRFGPPDARHIYGPGETYVRPLSEGGGITKTYPFEIWRYRFIERIGPDVEIEFVDPTGTGEFRLTTNPQEKDALLHTGGGPTEYERAGLESRYLRLVRDGLATTYAGPTKDLPFERMARLAVLDKPPPLRFEKLHEVVNASITYNQLPMDFRYTYIRLGQDGALALLNLEVPHSGLGFNHQAGLLRAEVEVYGRIVDMLGKVQAQFEETLAAEFKESEAPALMKGKSLLQKTVILKSGNYRLDLALKDARSGQIGSQQVRVSIPDLKGTRLMASPVILAHSIEEAGDLAGVPDPYLLGTLRVRPQIAATYSQADTLKTYFQVYNAKLEPTRQAPSLTVRYHLLKDKRLVFNRVDTRGETIQFFSDQRVVFLLGVALGTFEPGSYRFLVQITDNISGEKAATEAAFTLVR